MKGKSYEDFAKKAGEKYGYYNVDEFFDDSIKMPRTPSLRNYNEKMKKYTKEECLINNYEWVEGYTKRINGEIVRVKGYCREKHVFY